MRQLLHLQQIVAATDAVPVEGNVRVAGGLGSCGDHDAGGGDLARGLWSALDRVQQPQRVRVPELGAGVEDIDFVAHQLVARHVDLMADDVLGPELQILHGDVLFDGVGRAIQAAQSIAGEVQDGFPQGLARDRARVDAHPADHRFALDHRHAPVELGRLDGCALAGWARADHQHVVGEVRHSAPR